MPCSQTHSAAPARTRWLEAFTRSQTKQAQQHVSSTASHNHSNHNQKMCMQYPSLAPSTALSCSTPAAQPSRSSSSTVGWQPTLGTTHLAFLSASNDIKLVGRTKSYSHKGDNNFASLPEHELIKTEGTLFAAFFCCCCFPPNFFFLSFWTLQCGWVSLILFPSGTSFFLALSKENASTLIHHYYLNISYHSSRITWTET